MEEEAEYLAKEMRIDDKVPMAEEEQLSEKKITEEDKISQVLIDSCRGSENKPLKQVPIVYRKSSNKSAPHIPKIVTMKKQKSVDLIKIQVAASTP